jgi:hypothetical protein
MQCHSEITATIGDVGPAAAGREPAAEGEGLDIGRDIERKTAPPGHAKAGLCVIG